MDTINPYIGFNGRCREAMNFYKARFGGELDLQLVDGSPMEQYWPEGKGKIFHSALTLNGKMLLMGSDMSGPKGQTVGDNIQLAISCTSEEEIHRFFRELGEGGLELAPVSEMFWNALFGSVRDQFGINWMLNYNRS
ncbi:VOC family protein [Mucilaginibacter sp. OK098]|uniref:VOC family protein n=1 Tax=Mucilaginibacter sp. OK098 TaxID=1855297 RepID=UPI00091EA357|nr:VOC family protein [Mucilaginibacter sp. OK098]SHM98691.1 PhnB protein [Mucilaginibacter sp. OK098]